MNALTHCVKFALGYPPSVNKYWRPVGSRFVLTREGKAYKESAGYHALVARVRMHAGDLAVSLWVYRPQRTGDLDNRVKAVLDSLNGVAWADDSQIIELHLYRRDDKVNPRVEVEIQPAITGENNA